MVPANAFAGALWTNIAGFVIGAELILLELGAVRPARRRWRRCELCTAAN
jgi:hypothetical protein